MNIIIAISTGIGIGLGGIALGIAYKNQKKRNTKISRYNELINNKLKIDLLDPIVLSEWFKENSKENMYSLKMVVAIPTESVLKGLGYIITEPIDEEHHIIQWIHDDDTSVVLKSRLIYYKDIESNLQNKLLENDGILIITK